MSDKKTSGTTIRISDDTYDRLKKFVWARTKNINCSGGNQTQSDFSVLDSMFGYTPNDAISQLLKEAGF